MYDRYNSTLLLELPWLRWFAGSSKCGGDAERWETDDSTSRWNALAKWYVECTWMRSVIMNTNETIIYGATKETLKINLNANQYHSGWHDNFDNDNFAIYKNRCGAKEIIIKKRRRSASTTFLVFGMKSTVFTSGFKTYLVTRYKESKN